MHHYHTTLTRNWVVVLIGGGHLGRLGSWCEDAYAKLHKFLKFTKLFLNIHRAKYYG